jgi:membrane associated rhomboid family serine protease
VIPIGENAQRVPIFPFVVYGLIALNVWVFVQELGSPDIDRFINSYATIPYDITNGIVLPPPSPPFPALTILTAMFVHGSVLHILFNMLFLFVFGPEIEYLCGHGRFLAFYLICGIAGGIAQVAVGPGSHVPEIGASGAIAGVLGAYLINFPTASINTIVPIGCFPLFLRLPAILVIGLWALTQFVTGIGSLSERVGNDMGGGTAYFAHIGGFSAGVILIGLFKRRPAGTRRYRWYY